MRIKLVLSSVRIKKQSLQYNINLSILILFCPCDICRLQKPHGCKKTATSG